jgi:hypothetical protein
MRRRSSCRCPHRCGTAHPNPASIKGRNGFRHGQVRFAAHGSQPAQFQLNCPRLLVTGFVHPQDVLPLLEQITHGLRQVRGLDAEQGIPSLADKVEARLVDPKSRQRCRRQLPQSAHTSQSGKFIERLHTLPGCSYQVYSTLGAWIFAV